VVRLKYNIIHLISTKKCHNLASNKEIVKLSMTRYKREKKHDSFSIFRKLGAQAHDPSTINPLPAGVVLTQ